MSMISRSKVKAWLSSEIGRFPRAKLGMNMPGLGMLVGSPHTKQLYGDLHTQVNFMELAHGEK